MDDYDGVRRYCGAYGQRNSTVFTTTVPPNNYSQIRVQATAILDSGTSENFGNRNAEKYCTEVHDTTTPNGKDMKSVKIF